MQIDLAVTEDQLKTLGDLLGGDPEEMARIIAAAGAAELLENFTGTNTSANLSETKKLRTLCLLLACEGDPEVATGFVKRLYGLTDLQARNQITAAVARFPVQSSKAVNQAVCQRLDSATYKNERWSIRLPKGPVLAAILEKTGAGDQPDPERAGMGDIWRFADETYRQVRIDFRLPPRDPPKGK